MIRPPGEVVWLCPDISGVSADRVVCNVDQYSMWSGLRALASGMRQLAGTRTRYRRAHATPLAGLTQTRAKYQLLEHGVILMSQPSSDAAGAAYRRKVWTKLIVFFVLVAVVWLQPKIQAWLDGRNAGGSDPAARAEQHDSDPSITSQRPADHKPVVIRDVDEPVVAEVDRSDSTLSTGSEGRSTSVPDQSFENSESVQPQVTQKNSGSDVVRMDRDADTKRTDGKDSTTDPLQPKAAPALGQLNEIRKNVFESTAGLRYVPGSADNHRLRHVMQHAKDDTTKPVHGVFEGNRDQILAVIDEAYLKVAKGGRDVHREAQNDRLVYTVNLGRKIGYMGGSEGKRTNNPACRYVRMVLEDGNVVISAYPTKSF